MITGDHPDTAGPSRASSASCDDDEHRDRPGRELRALDDATLRERGRRDARVYARVDPAQKIRIVEALQARASSSR